MWPASVCGQPAWVAATQPGPRRPARTAGVTQPGGLGRPNQAGSPSPSVLPGPGNPGRPGWPAPPNQGGRTAQPVCLGHPASTHQPYGRLAGHPGPPGQPGLLSLAACRQQRLAAMAVGGSGRSARRARKGRRAPRARGHRPRSAASTASSSCARPSACAVIIMSCGVWVNSVKSMLGKLIIHLESQAQELTNHTHTRPWLLTEGVLGWWSGEHMRTRSPTPGGGRAGRHAARSAGVCGAATATPRARTRRPRRQGCLPRRAARARTAPASLDSRS